MQCKYVVAAAHRRLMAHLKQLSFCRCSFIHKQPCLIFMSSFCVHQNSPEALLIECAASRNCCHTLECNFFWGCLPRLDGISKSLPTVWGPEAAYDSDIEAGMFLLTLSILYCFGNSHSVGTDFILEPHMTFGCPNQAQQSSAWESRCGYTF